MKLPVPPPPWSELLARNAERLGDILSLRLGPEIGGRYEHWDHVRHLPPGSLDGRAMVVGNQVRTPVIEPRPAAVGQDPVLVAGFRLWDFNFPVPDSDPSVTRLMREGIFASGFEP